jgi:hypothetical protein
MQPGNKEFGKCDVSWQTLLFRSMGLNFGLFCTRLGGSRVKPLFLGLKVWTGK